MTRLSVNINKIATLRNARGEDYPNLIKTAQDIINFGAQGITIHPRPDERHIRYSDAFELKEKINTELNIEGNPSKKFIDLVNTVKPEQVTLVPDSEDAITSNAGWNTITNFSFLKDIVNEFQSNSIRVSIFIDPDIDMLEGAKKINADRVELFTGPYAKVYNIDKSKAIEKYIKIYSFGISDFSPRSILKIIYHTIFNRKNFKIKRIKLLEHIISIDTNRFILDDYFKYKSKNNN